MVGTPTAGISYKELIRTVMRGIRDFNTNLLNIITSLRNKIGR
jgi:hypothetical protein